MADSAGASNAINARTEADAAQNVPGAAMSAGDDVEGDR
jgi:hypothetical protein